MGQQMLEREPITILVTSDRLYLKHAAVMLASAAQSAAPDRVEVYFMPQGVPTEDVDAFRAVVGKYVSAFHLVSPPAGKYNPPSDGHAHVSTAAFGKIILPNELPSTVKRAIYMDGDMVVLKSLRDLVETDLEGNVVAAVENPGYKKWELTGISPESGYFNSGLILIDVDRWKEGNYTERVFECLRKLAGIRTTADQEGLNLAFNRGWKHLDQGWNHQTHVSPLSTTREDVERNAKVIHYTGSPKPWHFPRSKRSEDVFYRNVAKTLRYPTRYFLGYPVEDNLKRLQSRFKKG